MSLQISDHYEAEGVLDILKVVQPRRREERLATAALAALMCDSEEDALARLVELEEALPGVAEELHPDGRRRASRQAVIAVRTAELARQVKRDIEQARALRGSVPAGEETDV